jgi:hypothetical protein
MVSKTHELADLIPDPGKTRSLVANLVANLETIKLRMEQVPEAVWRMYGGITDTVALLDKAMQDSLTIAAILSEVSDSGTSLSPEQVKAVSAYVDSIRVLSKRIETWQNWINTALDPSSRMLQMLQLSKEERTRATMTPNETEAVNGLLAFVKRPDPSDPQDGVDPFNVILAFEARYGLGLHCEGGKGTEIQALDGTHNEFPGETPEKQELLNALLENKLPGDIDRAMIVRHGVGGDSHIMTVRRLSTGQWVLFDSLADQPIPLPENNLAKLLGSFEGYQVIYPTPADCDRFRQILSEEAAIAPTTAYP